jgi:hypothetical protein
VSPSGVDKDRQARKAIQRVVDVARRGQARLSAYRQETAVLGTWLRLHLFRQGRKGQQTKKVERSLRNAVAARCLRQRQEVHRNGNGGQPSTAIYFLQRASQAVDPKEKR